ncbi:hypothetical protein AAG570_005807, partial [Ranatra chinensis]
LATVAAVLACVLCQRPPYVSGPLTYPGPLPQYGQSTTLEDRLGEETTTPRPTSTVTSLPGSIYEQELIDRVPEWPADKRPFWFINNQFIQNQTGFRPQQENTPPSATDSP